ncbi:MAG: hypothetical protein GXP29_01900 [Planctomycetes bacterium]|nr:hypothetical protein [Planctomycetota bacterium]
MSSHQRINSTKIVLVALLLPLVFAGSSFAQRKNIRALRYDHYLTRSGQAYEEKNWDQAIFYGQLTTKLFPLRSGDHYNLACCYALAGQTGNALDTLETSIRCGWSDPNHLKRDSDLKSLRKEDRYKELVKSAIESAKETKVIYQPTTAKKGGAKKVLVALHGFGGNPRAFVGELSPVADRLGIPLIALKGRGPTRQQGLYGWHKGANPRDLDVEGTAKRIDQAAKDLGFEPADIIVVGFSQGGAVALNMLADYPGKYQGALTVAAGNPHDVFHEWMDKAKDNPVRVFMIAGALDKDQPFSLATLAPLSEAGVKLKYLQLPAIGHEMPPNSTDLYVEAIEFLTAKD